MSLLGRHITRLFSASLLLLGAHALPGQEDQQLTLPEPASMLQPCLDLNPCPVPLPSNLSTDMPFNPTQSNADTQRPGNLLALPKDRVPTGTTLPLDFVAPIRPSEFQLLVAGSTGRVLPIFGASLFSTPPSTFAPADNIPVPSDYVIGPGDELRIQIWGQINQQGNFVVDRTGSIAIPKVGAIDVGGVQVAQLPDFLRSKLARIYRNFDLSVDLGQLRSIHVFVVGQARQPGTYTIASLSTLFNAIFASGGPLPQGSLRDIQVQRNGQTITHFDLYDLILHGDKSKDVRLESGDVILYPDVGPQIAITGSVATPAIYELHGETTVGRALALAGGLTSTAANSPLRVERIDSHRRRSMVEVDLAAANSATAQNGDIITADSILGHFQNAVILRGNIANPGRYPWHEGMRISDLIPDRAMLITRDYDRSLNQLGRPAVQPTLQPSAAGALGTQSGRSSELPSGSQSQPGQAQPTADQQPRNGISGNSGLAAGDSAFGARNDVVLTAPEIDWEYAVVQRQNSSDLTTLLMPFNLGKAVINHDPSQDLTLLAGDIVTIFSKADIRVPHSQQTKFVRLEGEFAAAGVYSVQPGETLRHLIARAGGLTPSADLFAASFTRESVRRMQKQRLNDLASALDSQISANSVRAASSTTVHQSTATAAREVEQARAFVTRLRAAQPNGRIVLSIRPEDSSAAEAVPDLELQDGDHFVVPSTPSTVNVQGEVNNASAFVYFEGGRVRDYLSRAGGPSRIADPHGEFIIRANGSVISQQHGNFKDVVLYPGDTIVVPPLVGKTPILRNISYVGIMFEAFGLSAGEIQVFNK